MWNKIKTWIIKKLGGYTSTEYKHMHDELVITDRINRMFVNNREVKTIRFITSQPDYFEYHNFDIKKYALAGMVDKIIESGAVHVAEFPNSKLCCTDVEVTLKVVV